MSDILKKFIPFFIGVLFLIIIISFLIKPQPIEFDYEPEEEQECGGGDVQECFVGNCSGTSTCVNGEWSVCNLDMVCTPGDRVPCVEGGCVNGYKECDECGTGYGPCIAQGCCG